MWEFFKDLLPVLSLIIGALLTMFASYLADFRLLKRERTARKEQQYATLYLKRIEFQRETLIQLQDVIDNISRKTAEIQLNDIHNYNQGTEWKKISVPDDLDELLRATKAKLIKLKARIEDEKLRKCLDTFNSISLKVTLSENKAESEHQMQLLSHSFEEVQNLIGENFRQLNIFEDKQFEG
ncbi:hypothetical protein [Entomomonas asaccharolytica]|uniref:Uncharacterized protein n=1 Tax=Entomomonas asaccharolytica TaxID=2785331 RepID=A0A974RXD6_9GAMM|nr:hypothetical protein [Entomomonas asaccharolytica]QQP86077.1 hypothetical protein JHT90_02135 [Entomomonas asaccharolytica]